MLIKNATIVFDKKYEKCLQDIRKKDILGTYRIKQILKNRLGQESNQRCLDYTTNHSDHSATAETIAGVRV